MLVRPLATADEYQAAQDIQRRAWGIQGDGYLMPVALMISVQHAGGLVLGAFDDDKLVGMSMAYLARIRGRQALYSQITAADPLVQSRGVGGAIKRAQREWARQQALDVVVWCFDPLQAGNANFNIHHLHARSQTYYVNHYGERHDALNAGMPTDRLLVEWDVDELAARWAGDGQLTPWVDLRDEKPVRHDVNVRSGLALRVCIPHDVMALKHKDLPLALEWQRMVRAVMQEAFAAGFVAMDFRRDAIGAPYYVLRTPELT